MAYSYYLVFSMAFLGLAWLLAGWGRETFWYFRKIEGERPPPWFYQSAHWKELAARIRKERKFVCELCGGHGFQIHHARYARPGREDDGDLYCLCSRCHAAVHRARWKLPLRQLVGRWLHG